MAVVEELFTDIKRRISAENLEKGIDIGVKKGKTEGYYFKKNSKTPICLK